MNISVSKSNGKTSRKWNSNELKALIQEGVLTKITDETEHIALHPFWLSNTQQGILEELDRQLGKYSKKFGGYLVAYNDIKRDTSSGAMMNADQPWVHIDVRGKFYIYKPEIGQMLKGKIRHVGETAAICNVFDLFHITVSPAEISQIQTWKTDAELEFKVTSVVNGRKGPQIRGKCLT